ncbi:spore coat protein [Metabacillus sediminilitoris]|jgi:spore coat protein CotF|uniref:Spore coat protein n=1 Tax=Metabacillus sediminilitoris TaxID=2567941 RepID=A0A4S4C073_9BACI|nr:spore coat protein [Metabacillus sediminilitoris]QGQ47909.1 spore coat protein [Metabacillus sediminilitoris]THF80978.1 spore coat protein [Metabacillus sediminilitoris]
MNNNQPQKIANPETQIQKGPQMNDRDFVNDLLATEKYMTDSYSTALNEASHQALYQDILTIFNETQQAERDLYNYMFQNGWYSLEAAETQKLQQSYQQFSNYLQQQSPYGMTQ